LRKAAGPAAKSAFSAQSHAKQCHAYALWPGKSPSSFAAVVWSHDK